MIPLIFPKVPQSSLGTIRVPQLPPPLKNPITSAPWKILKTICAFTFRKEHLDWHMVLCNRYLPCLCPCQPQFYPILILVDNKTTRPELLATYMNVSHVSHVSRGFPHVFTLFKLFSHLSRPSSSVHPEKPQRRFLTH